MRITSIQRGPEDAIDYPAGSIIFNADDQATQMYVVVAGEVEVRYKNKVLEVIGEGGIVGELSLIDDSPRSAEAIALTDCKLAGVSREKFLSLVQRTPLFALEVMTLMAERLRRQTTSE
jgi:CRP-like cAMP-binding protein